jgi:hypothetical protein
MQPGCFKPKLNMQVLKIIPMILCKPASKQEPFVLQTVPFERYFHFQNNVNRIKSSGSKICKI